MTKEEFDKAWDNYELDEAWADFCFDNYPDKANFEMFEESMVTE